MSKKAELLKFYIENSTPQELFIDALEKLDELKNEIDSIVIPSEKTEDELREIIKPLIPKVKDGKTPSEKQIREIIIPLIPDPIQGKDGSIIEAKEIRNKLKELKGKERLSIYDLKDIEWLKGKDKMQWSSAGFKVYTDSTLTGDGSFSNPLHAVSSGSPVVFVDNEVVSGSGTTFTLANTPTIGSVKLYAGSGTPGGVQRLILNVDYTISGKIITIIANSYPTGGIIADYRM